MKPMAHLTRKKPTERHGTPNCCPVTFQFSAKCLAASRKTLTVPRNALEASREREKHPLPSRCNFPTFSCLVQGAELLLHILELTVLHYAYQFLWRRGGSADWFTSSNCINGVQRVSETLEQ